MIVKKKRKASMKHTWDDKLFDFLCNLFLVLFVIAVFYPIYFVVVASFTDPIHVNSGRFLLYPVELNLDGYRKVFSDMKVWKGYVNTIIYTVGGTLLGTVVTVMSGYALSRKDMLGRGIIMKLFVFTMYFSGGMIPTFLMVKSYGLLNTRILMMIMGSVSVYNIIIVRSFMASNIPDELMDAATIDGCGNGNFFIKVVLPLSKAVVSVMVLYIAVSHWNSYFNAMIYLTDSDKYPLQLYLREILFQAKAASIDAETTMVDPVYAERMRTMAEVVKYGMIVVSTAPIICVYPFIQKYFVKGVMIGSIKG